MFGYRLRIFLIPSSAPNTMRMQPSTIESPEVAREFTLEFHQMFEEGKFSIHKKIQIEPREMIFADGSSITVGFSPQHDVISTMIRPALAAAQSEIVIGMFFLSDPSIFRELGRARQRGVTVKAVVDAGSARHPSSYHNDLRDLGAHIRIEDLGGKMHAN